MIGAGVGPEEETADLATIAYGAGDIILRHYAQDAITERRKEDRSPVTDADEEAEAHILDALRTLAPGVPVIAEEEIASGRMAEIGRRFFLVDPLDGTKEFLNGNGEFTVNIGEVIDGRPLRGVVYAPAKRRLFAGDRSSGAFDLETTADAKPDFARISLDYSKTSSH